MIFQLTRPSRAYLLERKRTKCDIGSIFPKLERGERREDKCGLGTKMELNTAELEVHNSQDRFENRRRSFVLPKYVCPQ